MILASGGARVAMSTAGRIAMRHAARVISALAALCCACSGPNSGKPDDGQRTAVSRNPNAPAGVVSFVSVVSDRVADVSSLEAWQQSVITPGMSDADKAQSHCE
jgi:hypothetical protein